MVRTLALAGRLAALVTFLVAPRLALGSSVAHADALAPPPTDCPLGSIGTTGRRGPHCELAICEGGCPPEPSGAPRACSREELALCVQTIDYPAADVQQGPRLVSLPAETWHLVHGPCAADGACVTGSRCERRYACVPASSPQARNSMMCEVIASRPRAPFGVGLAGVVVTWAGARRARRPRTSGPTGSRARDMMRAPHATCTGGSK